jgi:hypothetical protein
MLVRMSLIAIALSSPAFGQAQCGDRDAIVAELATKYNETRLGGGIDWAGALIEVFTSQAGTWTALMTMPDGRTCMVSAGENWETFPQGEGI